MAFRSYTDDDGRPEVTIVIEDNVVHALIGDVKFDMSLETASAFQARLSDKFIALAKLKSQY